MVNCEVGKNCLVQEWNEYNNFKHPNGQIWGPHRQKGDGYFKNHPMFAFPQPWTKIKFDEDTDTLLPGEVRGTGKYKNYKFRLKEGYTMDDHAWAIKWIQACNNANFTADDVYILSECYGVCSKHWNKELIDGVMRAPYVIKKGNRIMPPNKPPEIVPANSNTNLPAPASLQVKTTPKDNQCCSKCCWIYWIPSLFAILWR